jgi:antitoxin (DNA-binding transcriptional repressor) of toxin-antitoxin stability system
MNQVVKGEDIVITKNDRSFVRLSAVNGKHQHQFGSVKGDIWMSDDFDKPLRDFQEYM